MHCEIRWIYTVLLAAAVCMKVSPNEQDAEENISKVKMYEFRAEDLGIRITNEEELVTLLSEYKNTDDFMKRNSVWIDESKSVDFEDGTFLQKRDNVDGKLIKKQNGTINKINIASLDILPPLFDDRNQTSAGIRKVEQYESELPENKSIMSMFKPDFSLARNSTNNATNITGLPPSEVSAPEDVGVTSNVLVATTARQSIIRDLLFLQPADLLENNDTIEKSSLSNVTESTTFVNTAAYASNSTTGEHITSEDVSSSNTGLDIDVTTAHSSSVKSTGNGSVQETSYSRSSTLSSTVQQSSKVEVFHSETTKLTEKTSELTSTTEIVDSSELPNLITTTNYTSDEDIKPENGTLRELQSEKVSMMGGLMSTSVAACSVGIAAFLCGVIFVTLANNQKSKKASRQSSYTSFSDV